MAYKRNNHEEGHVNGGADEIEHADESTNAKNGTNQTGVHEYAFKHPFGNVMLGEDHDQVDTFQMSYLLMAMAVLGFIVLVSIAIVILAEIDQLNRGTTTETSSHTDTTTVASSGH